MSQFAVICILIGAGQVASAENWQMVATVKNGLGEDGRVVEIDADTVKRGKEKLSVRVRETTQSIVGSVGYSCREGDIRHGKTDKEITEPLCGRPSAPNPEDDRPAGEPTVNCGRETLRGIFNTEILEPDRTISAGGAKFLTRIPGYADER